MVPVAGHGEQHIFRVTGDTNFSRLLRKSVAVNFAIGGLTARCVNYVYELAQHIAPDSSRPLSNFVSYPPAAFPL